MCRFVGRYDALDGGRLESIAPTLSGGIHDAYSTQAVLASNGSGDLPSIDELFDILVSAIRQNNIVSTASHHSTSEKYGIKAFHEYAVTQVYLAKRNNARFVKLHNPHNCPDQLKRFKTNVYFADAQFLKPYIVTFIIYLTLKKYGKI